MKPKLGRAAIVAAFAVLHPFAATAAERTLTLEEALSLARERGPSLLAARKAVDEARGQLAGATPLFSSNPYVQASAGPRTSPDQTTTDVTFALAQTIELGGKRGARVAAAEAAIARSSSEAERAEQILTSEVARAFLSALQAGEERKLFAAATGSAAELASAAERRYQAGDIGIIDFNLAAVAHASAQADEAEAAAHELTLRAELQKLLGAEETLTPSGSLLPNFTSTLAELRAASEKRPDLSALRAAIAQAEAETESGSAARFPDVTVGAQYDREGSEDVFTGTLTVPFPLFDRGQAQTGTGRARAERLRIELDAAQRTLALTVESAFKAYEARKAGADKLKAVLHRLDENDALTAKAYAAGELNLQRLLFARQQAREARVAYLNHSLAAALAAVDLRLIAGVLP